ncbi:MAG: response regulator transcription factor [Flavobacteriales bacterium]|nr:response regulator transcription factor [Flavobacteriales bacterium]MCB9198775.1 response regulator transcription factor [Flavobacteriales bacterium]
MEAKIKAIIVDDEESARDVLENLLLRFCPEVTVAGKCSNVSSAVTLIKTVEPQLVFLDIEMPNYAGYEIVNFFDDINFKMVFVTAYDNYAVRAFEVAAVDYLLKPVNIERLKEAVRRVGEELSKDNWQSRMSVLGQSLQSKTPEKIVLTDKGMQYVVNIEDVVAIEAQEAYCLIHTVQREFLMSKNLKHFELILDNNPKFVRVHKSWLINLDHMVSYSKSDFNIVMSKGIIAKLSKYKKAEFEAILIA